MMGIMGVDGNGWEMMAMRTIRKEWERMGGASLNLFCFFRSKIEMGRGWCDAPPLFLLHKKSITYEAFDDNGGNDAVGDECERSGQQIR